MESFFMPIIIFGTIALGIYQFSSEREKSNIKAEKYKKDYTQGKQQFSERFNVSKSFQLVFTSFKMKTSSKDAPEIQLDCSIPNKAFYIDNINNKIAFFDKKQLLTYNIYNSNTFIDCELLEDNSTIMKNGIGRAVVGGIIAGGTGAIVGATTRKSRNVVSSIRIRIITNDATNALIELDILETEIERNAEDYKKAFKFANEIYASVVSLMEKNK